MKFINMAFALSLIVSDLVPYSAFAATQIASFSVTATVISSCQISAHLTSSRSDIAAMVYPASPVSVICTSPTPYNVSYSTGMAPSVTVTTRKAVSREAAPGTGNKSSPSDAISSRSAEAPHDMPYANAHLVIINVTY